MKIGECASYGDLEAAWSSKAEDERQPPAKQGMT